MMTIKDMLNEMKDNTMSELQIAIIDDMLDVAEDNEELKDYMEDVMNHGCQSGVVGSLTYYYQTDEFFKKHYEEIFELYNEVKEEMNLDFELNANNLSWFTYETITCRIYNELELEN